MLDGASVAAQTQDLLEELRHLDSCRSGEARSCKAYGMPCQRLLLTVGPKYKDWTCWKKHMLHSGINQLT